MAPRWRVSTSESRAILDIAISEKDFQQTVVDLAKLNGWMVHKVYDSRRSPEGWPDLFLVRDGQAYAWELKREGGTPTLAQDRWIRILRQIPGVWADVMWPSDWWRIEELLSRPEEGRSWR